jgi:septal ring factor EnvC (AmiA/AmiB activator)
MDKGQHQRHDQRLSDLEREQGRIRDQLDEDQEQFYQIGVTLGKIEKTLDDLEQQLSWNRRLLWGLILAFLGLSLRALLPFIS